MNSGVIWVVGWLVGWLENNCRTDPMRFRFNQIKKKRNIFFPFCLPHWFYTIHQGSILPWEYISFSVWFPTHTHTHTHSKYSLCLPHLSLSLPCSQSSTIRHLSFFLSVRSPLGFSFVLFFSFFIVFWLYFKRFVFHTLSLLRTDTYPHRSTKSRRRIPIRCPKTDTGWQVNWGREKWCGFF